MDKEALKALGLNDEQVAAVFEDYGKNYVTKVGRIAESSFCVKRKIAGSLESGALHIEIETSDDQTSDFSGVALCKRTGALGTQ